MSGEPQGPKFATGVIEARLGRSAQDVLEAAVVLEAWGGMRANAALSLGSRVVPPKPPSWSPGRFTTEESGRRDSILTEAIALIMALSIRRPGSIPDWVVPSSARTSFRPPRLWIEIGMRTVTVRPSPAQFGLVITRPSAFPV